MKKHSIVRITKIKSNEQFVPYEVEGALMEDIIPGEPVYLLRTKRNGVPVLGIFETSIVISTTLNTFETENSVYSIEEINEDNYRN